MNLRSVVVSPELESTTYLLAAITTKKYKHASITTKKYKHACDLVTTSRQYGQTDTVPKGTKTKGKGPNKSPKGPHQHGPRRAQQGPAERPYHQEFTFINTNLCELKRLIKFCAWECS
jgi:hypothetical protein